jgi:hypothetical protein
MTARAAALFGALLGACSDGGDGLVLRDVDGAAHAPMPSPPAIATVLFFVLVDCPIANAYAPEIAAIVRDHGGPRVRFYVVHADPTVAPSRAAEHAREFAFGCPVLLDPEHRLVTMTGARTTPEAAIVTAAGQVAYCGRIDDRFPDLGIRRVAPRRRDLRDAIAAVLDGRPVVEPRVPAVGCDIPDVPR